MKRTKTALCTALFAALTFSANAQAYPDLPVGIKSGAGALIGDTVYVGLGSGGDKFYSLNLKDPAAQWQEIAAFPGGERNQPVAAAVAGKLYVFGGLQKNEKGELQLVNDAYQYNPTDNTWTKLPTRSPRGLVGSSGASYGDKVYIVGGSNLALFNGFFQDMVAAGEDKMKKEAITATYFNQRPEDYFFTTELLSYEPSTNQWRNEGRLPFSGRAGAALTIQGNALMVVNGEIKPGLRTAETHQGQFTNQGVQWKNLPDLPAPEGQSQDGLAGAMAGYSHGYYLVTGGANFPGSVKQFKSGMLHAHKGLNKAWHKEIYTFNNGKWRIIGELPMNIGYGLSVSYDNKVLLIGGETDGGKALTSVKTLSYDGKKLTVE
ncbi:N-acetylneuraminic acid mutarotase [Rodentibacter trehalosifermentans]|uniref:N-acetylneuraminate epimerase n=1 Tax=Rodentibacter trehalosifermentans TaxID=1908263 RepID=A0A1V3J2N9_9PAST|nr:N-acetylneuraminate epimerase [Rodentibacter trehalosifermentans]OOF45770.1 N-acetylneuraminic acid mutarotase [Rodentibacter trehalosifermentans]OOF49354.1 N-acetylneuraminic acid mutarotase [Rodentibacter trehalosifermentans]